MAMLGVHRPEHIWEPTLFSKTAKNTVVQFFLDGDAMPKLKDLQTHSKKIAKAIDIANKRHIAPVIHLPYSITLATAYRPYFRAYVKRAVEIAASFTQQAYIIMHLIGESTIDPTLIAWFEKTFPKSTRPSPILTFENTIHFTATKDLKAVQKQLSKCRIGFCIDLAHLWGGDIDVRTKLKMQTEYRELKNAVHVVMYHLNPPRFKFGRIIDRHGDMDTTPMRRSVMVTLLREIKRDNLVGIIERPSMSNVTEILKIWNAL